VLAGIRKKLLDRFSRNFDGPWKKPHIPPPTNFIKFRRQLFELSADGQTDTKAKTSPSLGEGDKEKKEDEPAA